MQLLFEKNNKYLKILIEDFLDKMLNLDNKEFIELIWYSGKNENCIFYFQI